MRFCTKCGNKNDDRALFCQSCGNPFEVAAVVSPTEIYGGFWKRFAAWVIDTVIVHTASGILVAATVGIGVVAIVLLPWVYEAWLHSSEWQATVGKRVLGMVVTDMNGTRISFARATGRHFAKYVSAFILGIGFIMAAFTERKQALHDMMADTLVVNRSS